MKTVHNHTLQATSTDADHSNWGDHRGKVVIKAAEIVGDQTNKLDLVLDPKDAKDLMRRLRNALIDAKVLRGKKTW